MAKLFNNDGSWSGDDMAGDQDWAHPSRSDENPQPLSQEWFRAHPQWTTDRLMHLGKISKETSS